METAGQTKAPKPRRKKRLIKILLIILVLLVLFILLLPAIISSGPVTEFIVGKVNDSVDGKLTIDNLAFGYIKGVKVTAPSFVSNDATIKFSADAVSTEPSLLPLIFGELTLGKTQIDKPHIVIEIDQPETKPAAQKPSSGPKVKTDTAAVIAATLDLYINDGTAVIFYNDQKGKKQTLELQQIQAMAKVNRPGKKSEFDLSVDVIDAGKTAKLNAKGHVIPPAGKNAKLSDAIADVFVKVQELDLETLSPAFELTGNELKTKGKLNAELDIKFAKGIFEKINANVVFANPAQQVNGKLVSLGEDIVLKADISTDQKGVNFDHLDISSSFCDISCTGNGQAVQYAAEANLKSLFGIAGEFVDTSGYSATGTLNGKGQLFFGADAFKLDGQWNAENLTVKGIDKFDIDKENVSLDFKAEYGKDNMTIKLPEFALDTSVARLDKGSLTAQLSGQRNFSAGFNAVYDIDKVKGFLAQYLPKDFDISGKRSDRVELKGKLPDKDHKTDITAFTAKAGFGFDTASYKGLKFDATALAITLNRGIVAIEPFSTKVNQGDFNFAGQIDLNAEKLFFQTTEPMEIIKGVKINDEMTKELLRYVNPLFANAVNVSGDAYLACDELKIPLKGSSKKQAVVAGTLAMKNISLRSSDLLGQILSSQKKQRMEVMPTRFALRDGWVRYEDMQVNIGDNPTNFKGGISLNKRIDMEVILPWSMLGETAKVSKELEGRISFKIQGDLDKPTIDISKALDQVLQQVIEKEIIKGIEKLFE